MQRTIDPQTMTLYAELLDQMQMLDASRTASSLKGSFSCKTIKGAEYVYFDHYTLGGRHQQTYIGKRDDRIEGLIRKHAERKADALEMKATIKRLGGQVRTGVNVHIDNAMVRVIQSLADAGVFKNGGVLVGTHAFQAIGVMLGVRWPRETMATTDIDVAVDLKVSVAIPAIKTDIPETIESLEFGFSPVPPMDPRKPSTSFKVRKQRLSLEIITPKITGSNAPVFIRRFNCGAQPLSYLSYLIEKPVQAVIIGTDPVLVNVPEPARYALHKLIVSQVRDASKNAKREKDLSQAYHLLSLLQEIRPDDIRPAWENLVARGPKWKNKARKGWLAMEKRHGKIEVQIETDSSSSLGPR
jgi:hypothetical protein